MRFQITILFLLNIVTLKAADSDYEARQTDYYGEVVTLLDAQKQSDPTVGVECFLRKYPIPPGLNDHFLTCEECTMHASQTTTQAEILKNLFDTVFMGHHAHNNNNNNNNNNNDNAQVDYCRLIPKGKNVNVYRLYRWALAALVDKKIDFGDFVDMFPYRGHERLAEKLRSTSDILQVAPYDQIPEHILMMYAEVLVKNGAIARHILERHFPHAFLHTSLLVESDDDSDMSSDDEINADAEEIDHEPQNTRPLKNYRSSTQTGFANLVKNKATEQEIKQWLQRKKIVHTKKTLSKLMVDCYQANLLTATDTVYIKSIKSPAERNAVTQQKIKKFLEDLVSQGQRRFKTHRQLLKTFNEGHYICRPISRTVFRNHILNLRKNKELSYEAWKLYRNSSKRCEVLSTTT